jgi:hypothetical protein
MQQARTNAGNKKGTTEESDSGMVSNPKQRGAVATAPISPVTPQTVPAIGWSKIAKGDALHEMSAIFCYRIYWIYNKMQDFSNEQNFFPEMDGCCAT